MNPTFAYKCRSALMCYFFCFWQGMDTFTKPSVRTELCDQLHISQQSGNFCDVNIKVHGHTVPAHRVVLAASSQYFRSMFEGGFKESKETVIDLSQSVASVDTLNTVLKFMYTGDLELTLDTLDDILGASSLFMLEHVIGFCLDFMLTHLHPSNCLHMWELAEIFNLADVSDGRRRWKTMARCRFRDHIQYQPDMLDLSSSFLMRMVNHGVMDFLDANEIGTLLLKLFQGDRRESYCTCKKVLKYYVAGSEAWLLKFQRLQNRGLRTCLNTATHNFTLWVEQNC